MKEDNPIQNNLTNKYISPLEAHRLATNLKMIKQARKEQEAVPWQINAFMLLVILFYVLFAFLCDLGFFEFLKRMIF